MAKKTRSNPRREDSLSRDRIIEASIAILDGSGEDGLTFRALSERLATGPGAIYWHVPNKGDLLTAACDAIIARTMDAPLVGATPQAIIRALALGLFDAIDAHPWVGSALTRAPGQLPMVRILERIGRQVRALGVPDEEQWATVGALLNYILGVGAQNAANGQLGRTRGIDRSDFLDAVATTWSQLDPDAYAFTRSMAAHLRGHDDRRDFLAGIDLILSGIEASRRL
ncbi:TetR/AcrR family transcriptional regulator [Tardiphaga robiniae]|uniref:TetR family transcriptional regulator n=1 Tax=Tardiphaga robiniae TaxID=943830 RepID=A0A7G6TYN2_9BRAD|nr:TetR family transcriptional regulator [Tardiphaga robiniae]QND71864.1 TetR family transcriptional regulator [Tardiphaga robiniae]